jgi:hypothetical protein
MKRWKKILCVVLLFTLCFPLTAYRSQLTASQVNEYIIPGSPLTMSQLATALNNNFAAVASQNRGSTAPSNPVEGMLWWDSSANPEIIKRYTAAAGWVSLFSVNITTGAVSMIGYVPNTLFDANTILAATSDNTPAAVTVAEQRILGRKTGGNIVALTAAEVNAILGGAVLPWVLITEVKSAGTNGGYAGSGTWNVRALNTITGITGYGNWCAISSYSISLAVGTYYIEASAPAFDVGSHKLGLYDISTSAFEIIGTAERSASTAPMTRSHLQGLLTVSGGTRQYRLAQYTQNTKNTTGLGYAVGTENEIYAVVKITKFN